VTRYVAGLDLSLRCAGVALVPTDWAPGLDWSRVHARSVGVSLKKDATEWERGHRVSAMSRAIVDFLGQFQVERTFIEQYAFSQMLSQAHSLGELGGAVKLRLYEAGLQWSTVVATSARTHLGKMPRKGAKDAAHEVLEQMGCPKDWKPDEKDALIIANAGLFDLGRVGFSLNGVAA
jgi:Holliday junction resolvasome RuvABC endonuclease subunit